MKITKCGKVSVSPKGITISKFTFDCEGESMDGAQEMALLWALEKIEGAMRERRDYVQRWKQVGATVKDNQVTNKDIEIAQLTDKLRECEISRGLLYQEVQRLKKLNEQLQTANIDLSIELSYIRGARRHLAYSTLSQSDYLQPFNK
jgi:hypothetical protein